MKNDSQATNKHDTIDIQDAASININMHKQAAMHHIEAAKNNLAAIVHHQKGEYEKAAHHTLLALGHSEIAGGFLNDDAKHHAQALKQTRYQ